jgi:hypothetical protein
VRDDAPQRFVDPRVGKQLLRLDGHVGQPDATFPAWCRGVEDTVVGIALPSGGGNFGTPMSGVITVLPRHD